jgi:hypothetical protein
VSEQQPQQIGTDTEQSVHRDPAPTPAEHNDAFCAERPADCIDQQ